MFGSQRSSSQFFSGRHGVYCWIRGVGKDWWIMCLFVGDDGKW